MRTPLEQHEPFTEEEKKELKEILTSDKQSINTSGKKLSQTAVLSGLNYEPLYYEPKEIPNFKLVDCLDFSKFNAKVKALDEYDLTEEQKNVLKFFAYRFIKIDFEAVANYYSFCATEEEQKAIERLRLVLVDNGSVDGFIEDEILKLQNDVIEYLKQLNAEAGNPIDTEVGKEVMENE